MNIDQKIKLLCRWLRIWRIEKGLTQEQVSFATGVIVSNFENGRCEPRLKTLLIVCDFYGLSLEWMLGALRDISDDKLSDVDLIKITREIART